MKIKKDKRKWLAVAAVLAVSSLVVGTFASTTERFNWIQQIETKKLTGLVKLVEKFNPAEIEIKPGGETQKEVSIKNNANVPVFVRISMTEKLKSLQNGAEITEQATVWKLPDGATYDNQGENEAFPVLSELTALPDAYKGLALQRDITYQNGDILPAGIAVYASTKTVKNPISNKEETVLNEYVLLAEVKILNAENEEVVRYQMVKGELAIDDAGKVTVKPNPALQYQVYKNGYSWSKTAETKTFDGSALTKEAKIIPANLQPTATDKWLFLNFGKDVLGNEETLAKDKWVYNPEDGWFYYTSPLAPGGSTVHLLEALSYSEDLGAELQGGIYDLKVVMEAIQATPEALGDSDTAGWKLSGAKSDAIKNQLISSSTKTTSTDTSGTP